MMRLPILLVCVLTIPDVWTKPTAETTPTTPRSSTIGDTIKHITNQLMEANVTSDVVLDTRTPPKIKQQLKKKEQEEAGHAGVAVPLDADAVILEESTKKMNFYKLEKPTTNAGLSTWILLSGNQQSTTKSDGLVAVTEGVNRVVKPIFKRRSTTSTTTTTQKPTQRTGTTVATTELNKIKASILTSALSKRKPVTPTTTTSTTTIKPVKTKEPQIIETTTISQLKIESKDSDAEISTSSPESKKTRRPTTKKKKNKNKRKRPSSEKTGNSTKVAEKPVSSVIYSYLAREVMPTVGVGLVGLMVTAGLASYFLYPFGAARRSYEIDRKDKGGSYYYDYDSGGIAEEEAIGKVIAGMSTNYDEGGANINRRYSQRNGYRYPQMKKYDNSPISYQSDIVAKNYDQKFFVGSVSKEQYQEATPAAVPEHGPRNLKLRKRRNVADVQQNEIFSDVLQETTKTPEDIQTSTEILITTKKPNAASEVSSMNFLRLLGDLCRMKFSLGLELLRNATETVSVYLRNVQRKFDEHYREEGFHLNRTNY